MLIHGSKSLVGFSLFTCNIIPVCGVDILLKACMAKFKCRDADLFKKRRRVALNHCNLSAVEITKVTYSVQA